MRPREGSRKAAVYDAFVKGGLGEAQRVAKKLGLKEGTVKTWAGKWGRGDTGPAARLQVNEGPRYEYDTREKAEAIAAAKAKRNKMDTDVYSVVEKGGKFAIVAAHQDTERVPGVFKKGDRVRDKTCPNMIGEVTAAGPQQCEVKWIAPWIPQPTAYCTHYLAHVEQPAKVKTKSKRRK